MPENIPDERDPDREGKLGVFEAPPLGLRPGAGAEYPGVQENTGPKTPKDFLGMPRS